MKKIIPILMIGVFILSSIGAGAITNEEKLNDLEMIKNEQEIIGSSDSTHTVLAEYGTATWCGYCKYAHGALKELFTEKQFDFYFVSLVTDKNSDAENRVSEFNLRGYPTVYFDGGYRVNVGAGSVPSAKSAYKSSISASSRREVEDVDIDLSATWLGGTEIDIDVRVDNNEASTYGGHIRVFITEIESSEGWRDTSGDLYTFPLLDWAFNEAISISAGGSWSDSTTWNGATNGYSSVTEDNLMIIAAVYNDEWHQGYSDPPSGSPFDAYYVDETAGYRVGSNRAPDTPSYPNPYDGKTNVDVNADLSWQAEDPDWFDTLKYEIYFGTTNPPPLLESDYGETEYDPGILDYETNYYWKIIATDPYNESSEGPIWSFTTEANYPPSAPEIVGPPKGIPGQEYSFTFVSTDSDDIDLYYYIDWGDGNIEEWIGPYASGNIVRLSHIWDEQSTYTIKAKAKDLFDGESSWGLFNIEIPRTRNTCNTLLTYLLEHFTNAFPIFRQIFGL